MTTVILSTGLDEEQYEKFLEVRQHLTDKKSKEITTYQILKLGLLKLLDEDEEVILEDLRDYLHT